MDLVAINDPVSVLVGRHKRHESFDLAGVFYQEVFQVQQPHLFLLGRRLPARCRALVLLGAGDLDQPEARLEVRV